MTDGYRLRPPRTVGKAWHIRATYKGLRFEISTRLANEDEARAWAARYWEAIKADPIMNADDPRPPSVQEAEPEAIRLGGFEIWLMTNFALLGENIMRLDSSRIVTFHLNAGGYRQAQIRWEGRDKRMLEHRWKFLLRYRWLPRSIDHINQLRFDNRLENLRASTPKKQAANRGLPQFSPALGR